MDDIDRLESPSSKLIELQMPICLVGIRRAILCCTYVPIPAYVYDERRHDQPRHRNLMLDLKINDGVFITIETPFAEDVHVSTYHGTVIAILNFPHYPSAKIYGLRSQTGALRALVVPLSFSQFWLDLEEIRTHHSIANLASTEPPPTVDLQSLYASASTVEDSCDYNHDVHDIPTPRIVPTQRSN
ncbi:hypothetical protein H0H93_004768 [Arthromyces matolae]|nr:hypothetical protein H0H93_004768 [Arthromyces matolae]